MSLMSGPVLLYVNMLCISTKERKHVSQSKRRRLSIEINLQIYGSESKSVRSPSRKEKTTLYRLPSCIHTVLLRHEEVKKMTSA